MQKFLKYIYSWIALIFDPRSLFHNVLNLPHFWMGFFRLKFNGETIAVSDLQPCLQDRTLNTPFDPHYFYQAHWALKIITQTKPECHVDVGSHSSYISMLCAIQSTEFIDIRPIETNLKNLKCIAGSVLDLPYSDYQVSSMSCLHVIEHVGLGRYGDPLDVLGSEKACKELQRVVALGGSLLVSTPVGRSRACYNAHRVFSPDEIISFFDELELISFSGVLDNRQYIENTDISDFRNQEYACGFFHFQRKEMKNDMGATN